MQVTEVQLAEHREQHMRYKDEAQTKETQIKKLTDASNELQKAFIENEAMMKRDFADKEAKLLKELETKEA